VCIIRHEPRVGDLDCPKLTEKYSERQIVLHSLRPYKAYDSRRIACYWESGERFSTCSLEGAIRHQRCHHFYHQTFVSVLLESSSVVSLSSHPCLIDN
jgi:hypothetical protein